MDTAHGSSLLRYDPAAKELIRPATPLRERIYDSVRELTARLSAALKASR